jgi:ABC-2 type transport system ATP-binding protein
VLATHHLEEAETLCDRLAILYQGRISIIGAPSELKAGLGASATLEDVFAHYTGAENEVHDGVGAAYRQRWTAERLG